MIESLIAALEANAKAMLAAYEGVSSDAARWRPAPEKWSLLEILRHLADEERDDFRRRLGLILQDPELDWPPIDPEGWARDRSYNSADLPAALRDFSREREASLTWLRSLGQPDLNREKRHPVAGSLRAGDLLAAWVAHDLLHLRQIANTKLAHLAMAAAPFSIAYASPG